MSENTVRLEEIKVEEIKVEETKVETKVEEVKVEEVKVEEVKVEETKVETKVEEVKVEETKVETKVEEVKVVETKVEEVKVVETKVEEVKVVETKVESKAETGLVITTTPILTVKPSFSEYLVNMLIKSDNVKELMDKITFKIDDKIIVILKTILSKTPESLNKILDNIKDVLKDGLIDQKDIPKLIVLVAVLYKTDFRNVIKNFSLSTKEIVEFIKFLIKLIIELEYIHVSNKSDTFELVDTSGELLELVIPAEINKENCNSCWGNLFTCTK
jgi:hypothetical protein